MRSINLSRLPLVSLFSILAAGALAQQVPAISQQAYLKASETGVNFGHSVAVFGDTAVVAATGAGAVYVFVRSGTNWIQQAYLSVPASAVAISGDTIVVGGQAATYVFVRSGTTWTQQAYLTGSNTEPTDQFGVSLALSGDTLAVGAPWEDSNATGVNGNETDNSAHQSGAAYVFVRNGTTWTQQAYLKASNTGGNTDRYGIGDWFGYSVAVSGGTVVVGAWGEGSNATGVNGNQSDNSAVQSGAAYVFVRSGTTWSQQAYVKASNTEAYEEERFGWSVAASGNTLIVGAPHEDSSATGVNGNQSDNNANGAGAAYVFVRDGTNWSQQAYVKASNAGELDFFGYSVAISGETVVIGAYGEFSNATGVNGNQSDDSAQWAGAAYVFVRSGATWTQQAYLKASNPEEYDQFGWSVALWDSTAVIGANAEDSNATSVNGDQTNNSALGSGAGYVFVGLGPLPPTLAIERSAGNIRVAWPLPATDFVLDETSALASSLAATMWSQVPFPYQTNATHISITVPMPAGNRFYRLRKP